MRRRATDRAVTARHLQQRAGRRRARAYGTLRPRTGSLHAAMGTGENMSTLTILLIVVIVLIVFGGFGYSRRGR